MQEWSREQVKQGPATLSQGRIADMKTERAPMKSNLQNSSALGTFARDND